jgi:hypothetical protein
MNLLTAAGPVKDSGQAATAGRHRSHEAEPLGFSADVLRRSPKLLDKDHIRRGPDCKVQVGQGSDICNDNLDVASHCPVLPVAGLPAPRPLLPDWQRPLHNSNSQKTAAKLLRSGNPARQQMKGSTIDKSMKTNTNWYEGPLK